MSKRNMTWLVVVLVAGIVGWLAVGLLVGLIAAAVALAVSEFVERRARAQRRRLEAPSETRSGTSDQRS